MELTKDTILRAWRDKSYADSLPDDVREAIPAQPTNPDGSGLSDAELEQAAGGATPLIVGVAGLVGGSGGVGIGIGAGINALTD
jgi:mersacidin/lichenicidin family type 2 lantibiotic